MLTSVTPRIFSDSSLLHLRLTVHNKRSIGNVECERYAGYGFSTEDIFCHIDDFEICRKSFYFVCHIFHLSDRKGRKAES